MLRVYAIVKQLGTIFPWLVVFASALTNTLAAGPDALEQGFINPPASARPWVHWFWMDGNISPEGITSDLESLHRVGIGGVVLMDVTQEIPAGPVKFNSQQWHDLFRHAAAEAARLGLKFSASNDSGWTGSGGPWVTPELAMQKLVWSKTNFSGPAVIDVPLPPLPTYEGYSRDEAVVAFPSPAGDGTDVPGITPKLTGSWGLSPSDAAKLLDRNESTTVALPESFRQKELFLQLDFEQPYPANRLQLIGLPNQKFQGIVQAADRANDFRNIREFTSVRGGLDLRFDRLTARSYRIVIASAPASSRNLTFSEVSLNPVYEIPGYQAKSGLARGGQILPLITNVPAWGAIRPNEVLDLTTNLSRAGKLHWTIPPGIWTVLRFGHIPTGRKNPAARPGGAGLECDKLSREAIRTHFDGYLKVLAAESVGSAGQALSYTHGDSWECGFQNWTPHFRQEFQTRRGYNPLPYLPAFTGRIVANPEITERFLWDVRRTIADLFAEYYAGGLATLAHEQGMQLSLEAYGNGPFDDLQYGARADVPMSEFWNETDEDTKFHTSRCMASVAHTWGKPVVAAEAFTSWPTHAKWANHPFTLKPLGDRAFCEGVNRIVFHRFAHQPWTNRVPGMTMGMWGVHYERTQTWWGQSKPWHDYLARCQFLLQSGLFVADLLYLTDEGAFTEPPLRSALVPPPPDGYNYDLAHSEVVLNRLSVQSGRLMLPDGMSYRVLILPPSKAMTPAMLQKIHDLVLAGATIIGPPPKRAYGLSGFPASDDQVKQLTRQTWGDCDGKTILEHRLGQGKISWGKPLTTLLTEMGVPVEFRQLGPSPKPLRYIHRRVAEADVFFIANSNTNGVAAECEFRVAGKEPEFWDPADGSVKRVPMWRTAGGLTRLKLALAEGGSTFVVFRRPTASTPSVASVTLDGHSTTAITLTIEGSKLVLHAPSNGIYEVTMASAKVVKKEVSDVPPALNLNSDWLLEFPAKGEAKDIIRLPQLVSWTELSDPRHEYFSGAATYRKQVNIIASQISPEKRHYLNLGRVEVLAEVRWNNKLLPVLWKPPFTVEITDVIQAGTNLLEIKVVNLWPNRIIGDEQFPDDCDWRELPPGQTGTPLIRWPKWLLEGEPRPTPRQTFSTWKFYTKDSPLLPSGLVGPVVLRTVRELPLD